MFYYDKPANELWRYELAWVADQIVIRQASLGGSAG